MAGVDIATVMDFRDGEAGKTGTNPAEVDTHPGGHELVPRTPKPVLTADDRVIKTVGPGIAAVRVRLGVVLPNGRIAGRTDQIVHVVPLPPAAAEPAPLRAFCGLPIESDKADFVALISGPPCTRCLLVALEQSPPEPRSPRR